MELIKQKNTVIGILVRRIKPGSLPVTDGHHPLQVVTLSHPKGKYLAAHTHRPVPRKTERMQEALFVKKGKVRLDLFGPDKKPFKKLVMKAGDFFILQNGGLGIQMMEHSECVEFKNGPFVEDKVLLI